MKQVAECVQAEVSRQLGKAMAPVEFDFITDRPYNDQRYLIDYSKSAEEFGWMPKIPFEEGCLKCSNSHKSFSGLSKIVALHLQEKCEPNKKLSVVIYGGRGWVGQQVQKLFQERQIHYQMANCKVGIDNEEKVVYWTVDTLKKGF